MVNHNTVFLFVPIVLTSVGLSIMPIAIEDLSRKGIVYKTFEKDFCELENSYLDTVKNERINSKVEIITSGCPVITKTIPNWSDLTERQQQEIIDTMVVLGYEDKGEMEQWESK